MERSNEMNRRLLQVGFAIAGVAALSGLGYMVMTAIEMVRSGRGLETYRTFWLVEFNWVSFLVLVGVILLAFIVAAVFRFKEFLQWRSLEKKYGILCRYERNVLVADELDQRTNVGPVVILGGILSVLPSTGNTRLLTEGNLFGLVALPSLGDGLSRQLDRWCWCGLKRRGWKRCAVEMGLEGRYADCSGDLLAGQYVACDSFLVA